MSSEHPRRRGILIALAGLVVVLVGGGLWFWASRGAEEVSTDDVIDRFRDQSDGSDTTGIADDDTALQRPAAGVYTYEASGSEQLSLLDTGQQWGLTMPATVIHDADGCWTWRLDYSTNRWGQQQFCLTDGGLEEVAGKSFQQFDFGVAIIDTSDFECDGDAPTIRVDAEPGDAAERWCTGRSAERGTEVLSKGPTTFLGHEDVEIDGEQVPALHYRVERALSGDQTGQERSEYWYDASTGLVLKAVRSTEVASTSPIGEVVFTEDGSYQLLSLTPDT